jgi:hypothetical protein
MWADSHASRVRNMPWQSSPVQTHDWVHTQAVPFHTYPEDPEQPLRNPFVSAASQLMVRMQPETQTAESTIARAEARRSTLPP